MDIEQLKASVGAKFPLFGPNKLQELSRLVYEIARRDGMMVSILLGDIPVSARTFSQVKDHLLRVRFPESYIRGIEVKESFASVDIDPRAACDVSTPLHISPARIYLERAVEQSPLALRLRGLFPSAWFETIDRYKDVAALSSCGPVDYNRRLESFFLVQEQYDHFKPCPCTPGVVSCGYHNANFGFGCPFECSYCFLQNYTNAPGIVLPGNIDDFFKSFAENPVKPGRLGSGETADSLALDHITGFAPAIVEFFRGYPETIFEFKTKSDQVDGLLSVKSAPNIVVAWSVNPQKVIDAEEFYTVSLERRLAAAVRCAAAGYRIAFHFDPVFYYPGWQDDYASVVKSISRVVPLVSIAWISLGTLRMTIRQKKMIENRFPMNTILSSELVTAADGKVRYHRFVRQDVYRHMIDVITASLSGVPLYLCMEDAAMWRDTGLKFPCWGSGKERSCF